jgi:hypothetical protein
MTMAVRSLFLQNNRKVIYCCLDNATSTNIASPFAVLVPAYSQAECGQIEAMVGILVDMGCIEFSCVGTEGERLHDALDWVIEDNGALDVVTTWHTNEAEACEYFLFAAGGVAPNLLAMVSDHPALEFCLEKIARATMPRS